MKRICALFVSITSCLHAAESYDVRAAAAGVEPPCLGFRAAVLSATQSGRELMLRVGIISDLSSDFAASRPLKPGDVMLDFTAGNHQRSTSPSTQTLDNLFPSGKFVPHTTHAGLLTFGLAGTPDSTYTLHLPGFAPVTFALDPQRKFTPVAWADAPRMSPLNITIAPVAPGLAIFPMRLLNLIVRENALQFGVSFRNAHRTSVRWKGTLTGRQATLTTAHGERFKATEASDSLRSSIAPAGDTWVAGEDNPGWVRFPLPHPEASTTLTFSLPGYASAIILYDAQAKEWKPHPASSAVTDQLLLVQEARSGDREFNSVRDFLAAQAKRLNDHDFDGFLAAFRGTARTEMEAALPNWKLVSAHDSSLTLSTRQRILPDSNGRARSVRVRHLYSIDGLAARDHVFMDRSELDMQRDPDGSWHIDHLFHPDRQPFWKIGCTARDESEHFILFRKPQLADPQPIGRVLSLLERAHASLARSGLPLKSRYPAVLLDTKDDFATLTGADPLKASGAAISEFLYGENSVQMVHQMMGINEYSFRIPDQEWAERQREQTLVHELVHLALADSSSPWCPAWLVEGIAMHFAGQLDDDARRHLRMHLTPATTLMAITKFTNGIAEASSGSDEVMSRYYLGTEAVRCIAERYGPQALLEYYFAFNGREFPPEWVHARDDTAGIATATLRVTQRLMREKLQGLTLEQLDALARAPFEHRR